jgi:N-acetylneuraminic acid mutarotase
MKLPSLVIASMLLAACGGGGGGGSGDPLPPAPPQLPGAWATATALPEARTEVSATVYEGELYIAGGVVASGDARIVWVYDPAGQAWRELTRFPDSVHLHHTGIAVIDDRLYVVGGYAGMGFQESGQVHIYDFSTQEWTLGAPMPSPRGAHATVVLDGRIHAIGGTRGGVSVGAHEAYDPEADSWETLTPMTHNRDHLGAVAIDGRIYAAAGRDGINSALRMLEIYDPEQNAWTTGPQITTGRSGVGVAVRDGRMYVLGGETLGPTGRTFSQVERYDPETNEWTSLAPMPTARHGLGAGAIGDALHAVAGGPQPGFTFSAVHERLTGP